MRTLYVSISEIEYNKFGLKQEQLSFTEFIELVNKELMRQNLNKWIELADKYGLSKMSIDEISNEVKAVIKDAKISHWYKCNCFQNIILEFAEECYNDFIITGNTTDFTFSTYKQTKIVSPKEYWGNYKHYDKR